MEEPLNIITKREYYEHTMPFKRASELVELEIKHLCEDYYAGNSISDSEIDDDDLEDIYMSNNLNGFIITSRIKKYYSTLRKLKKKNCPATIDGIDKTLQDIAGIRILAPTLTDAYRICKDIKREFEVIGFDDYIENPKKSGYQSLHLIVRKQVKYRKEKKTLPIEIQIRTYAQHSWSYTEHKMVYSNPNPSDETKEKLRARSKSVLEFDQDIDALLHEE